MKRFILILLILLVLPFTIKAEPDTANWDETGFSEWQHKVLKEKHAGYFGSPIHNYIDTDDTFKKINNIWKIDGDSVFVDEAMIRPIIRPDGTSEAILTIGGNEYKVTQKLNRLIFFRSSDSSWINIDTSMNFSNRSISDNIIEYTNVSPAVDLSLIKANGLLQHKIHFKPAFLDSAIILYNQRVDSSDIHLANVIEYTLSNNITGHDISLGTIPKRILARYGNMVYKIESDLIIFPDKEVEVKQRWIVKNDRLYEVEFVKMSDIKELHEMYPDSTISHNSPLTFITTAEVDDSYVKSANSNFGFGAMNSTLLTTGNNGSGNHGGFSKFVVDDSIAATVTVDSTELHLYWRASTTDSAYIGYMTTEWVEGNVSNQAVDAGGEMDATWDSAYVDVSTPANNLYWSSGSFSSADYDDNSGSYYGKVVGSSNNGYLRVGEAASGNQSQIVQDWINGVITNYGFIFFCGTCGTTSLTSWAPSEFPPAGAFRPHLYVEWTDVAAGDEQRFRRRRLLLNRVEVNDEEIYSDEIPSAFEHINFKYSDHDWSKIQQQMDLIYNSGKVTE